MTDKDQIIIDGVDVSECEYLENGMCNAERESDGYTGWECCDPECSNCYYKQLARKTQECEYLEEEKRDKINLLAQIIEILYSEADEDELYRVAFNCEFIDKAKQLKNECDRYRKALEEIEGVTKELKQNICDNCGWHNTDGCNPCGNVCGDLIQILDIINKAKGEAND